MSGIHRAAQAGTTGAHLVTPERPPPREQRTQHRARPWERTLGTASLLLGPCVLPFHRGETEVLEGDAEVFGLGK